MIGQHIQLAHVVITTWSLRMRRALYVFCCPMGNFSTVWVTVRPLSSVEMVTVYSASYKGNFMIQSSVVDLDHFHLDPDPPRIGFICRNVADPHLLVFLCKDVK